MRLSALAAVPLAVASPALYAHPAYPTPQFVAARVSGPIRMDGRLDDAAWLKARPVDTCYQVYPHALAACLYPTETRIAYDDTYLYVGIRADDPHPGLIRSHFVRRDKLYSPVSDDYLHLYLDALDTGRSAQMFAVSPSNDQLDGFWNEATQTEDFTSDFNWRSATAVGTRGWTAEFRIPFSSLRYRPGRRQVWKLIVWRGSVRDDYYQGASAPIPNGANCLMCYAGTVVLDGFSTAAASRKLSLTPEITLTHRADAGDFGSARDNHVNLGGYLSWQPHAGTIVDGMWNPDFSQVESDDFQPTANNQFALLYPEKRPFFLESKNLLDSPLQAIYTRSIGEPRWGLRLTQQMTSGLFTALASEDQGGGSLIEPGILSSTLVPQPGASVATLGRWESFTGNLRVGGLFTWRHYDDGAHNLLLGPDVMWTPTDADRILAQYLYSATQNPNRPDLYTGWHGQSFSDAAAYLDWSHGTETWSWETTYQHLGDGFRAWEGFVPQVGVNEIDATVGHYFYPNAGGWINNVQPQLRYTRSTDLHGNLVLNAPAPALIVNGTASSYLEIAWHPDDRQLTAAGLQHLKYTTLAFTARPGARFTYASAGLTLGENVDYLTGDKGHGHALTLKLQAYPVDRLELDMTGTYQRLSADRRPASDARLFDERGAQLRALWYFASNLYLELSGERDNVRRNRSNYLIAVDADATDSLYTVLFAYEPAPRTHFYFGYHKNTASRTGRLRFAGAQTAFFAKMAYEFSM